MQRMTRQRRAISDLLLRTHDFRSAQQIHEELRKEGDHVGLATVYRALSSLTEDGDIAALRSDDGETLYRRCDSEQHHHHLVCRVCQRTEDILDSEVEKWVSSTAKKYGYSQVNHTAELMGTCGDCTAAGN